MAGGEGEIAVLPMSYPVRHVPRGSKQARLSVVTEDFVVRLPSWDADECPEVARLEARAMLAGAPAARRPMASDLPLRDGGVVYLAARGGDGAVRLVAPCDGPAFTQEFFATDAQLEARAERAREDPARRAHGHLVDLAIFDVPSAAARAYGTRRLAGDPAIGAVVSSGRDRARQHMARLSRALVLVDGRLHAPCGEPGWRFDSDMHHRVPGANPFSLVAVPEPPPWRSERFVPWCRDPARALAQLRPSPPPGAAPASHGRVEELVPGGLGGDWRWRALRAAVSGLVHPDADVVEAMLPEEHAMRVDLAHALTSWPQSRRPNLAEAAVNLARVIHGIKAHGNAAMLDSVLRAAGALRDSRAPPPLEQRLLDAGVEVAPLPGPAGAEPREAAAPTRAAP